MLDDTDSGALRRGKHDAASQAWYQWLLNRQRSRKLSPMDEFSWFEALNPQSIDLQSSSWTLVLGANVRRVGVVFGASVPDAQAINFSGTNGNLLPQYSVRVWPVTSPPDPNSGQNGLPVKPGGPPLLINQSEYGPLAAAQWYAICDTAHGKLFVCEIVLRDWPQQ